MSRYNNNIEAWEFIFENLNIIEEIDKNGRFIISATEINKSREARLMTKFDFKTNLPPIFTKNNLSILPISRGDYLIGRIQTFFDLNSTQLKIKRVSFPDFIETINHKNITSEAAALNCAYNAGIIQHFSNDEDIRPTVNGRMSSLGFNFNISSLGGPDLNITVNNSQIEIDGGYEGQNSFSIIEAKNSVPNDFLVRQLYYPYRLWSGKISKPVRPIYFSFSNGIYHLREFVFENPNHYNSIKLLREAKYAIQEDPITINDIKKILDEVKVMPEESTVAFPQADSMDRVINLCELLIEKSIITRDEVTSNYDFDVRQTNYYSDAARYLKLIQKINNTEREVCYQLTDIGKSLFNTSVRERNLRIIEGILEHKPFNLSLKLYFDSYQPPTIQQIVDFMKKSHLNRVEAESTFYRRAQTILSWINWILGLIE